FGVTLEPGVAQQRAHEGGAELRGDHGARVARDEAREIDGEGGGELAYVADQPVGADRSRDTDLVFLDQVVAQRNCAGRQIGYGSGHIRCVDRIGRVSTSRKDRREHVAREREREGGEVELFLLGLIIAAKIGCQGQGAFEVQDVCAGFVFTLWTEELLSIGRNRKSRQRKDV